MRRWDLDCARTLLRKGVSGHGIEELLKNNIRENMVGNLSESDLRNLNLSIGDRMILRGMASRGSGSHGNRGGNVGGGYGGQQEESD